ncbi:citrate/2-methylcitrate synthase [Planomicrobium sp. YIM 101495]|uniref:citrate/2-methylcitrate synthase n=1 Tax=Planomicrobium sp. YIM 101495 TaxID=2665160 RepID=UPI0012B7B2C7|nr:citrate/2-methylcitrate synthase [Planomicrobium sp. YIM 101495]MTD31232.1 hypothetical protein [Planomicrobium sp. YIM 101495]
MFREMRLRHFHRPDSRHFPPQPQKDRKYEDLFRNKHLLNAHKSGRALYVNVEFHAAVIMRAIAMPVALFTPKFSTAHIGGWTARLIEQQEDSGKNGRTKKPHPFPDAVFVQTYKRYGA